MAAGIISAYAGVLALAKFTDLATAAVKIALLKDTYTPDVSATGQSAWGTIFSHEIAAGNGYTAGGLALTGGAVNAAPANDGWMFTTNTALWTSSGGGIPAWRYAVIYVDAVLWGVTKPLLGYFLGDATGIDVPLTAGGGQIEIQCPPDGWIRQATG
jgi:hypothetical protein